MLNAMPVEEAPKSYHDEERLSWRPYREEIAQYISDTTPRDYGSLHLPPPSKTLMQVYICNDDKVLAGFMAQRKVGFYMDANDPVQWYSHLRVFRKEDGTEIRLYETLPITLNQKLFALSLKGFQTPQEAAAARAK